MTVEPTDDVHLVADRDRSVVREGPGEIAGGLDGRAGLERLHRCAALLTGAAGNHEVRPVHERAGSVVYRLDERPQRLRRAVRRIDAHDVPRRLPRRVETAEHHELLPVRERDLTRRRRRQPPRSCRDSERACVRGRRGGRCRGRRRGRRRRPLRRGATAPASTARGGEECDRAKRDNGAGGARHGRTLAHQTRLPQSGRHATIGLDPWGARDSRAERVAAPMCAWRRHRPVEPAPGNSGEGRDRGDARSERGARLRGR